jgi:hypothetical protein
MENVTRGGQCQSMSRCRCRYTRSRFRGLCFLWSVQLFRGFRFFLPLLILPQVRRSTFFTFVKPYLLLSRLSGRICLGKHHGPSVKSPASFQDISMLPSCIGYSNDNTSIPHLPPTGTNVRRKVESPTMRNRFPIRLLLPKRHSMHASQQRSHPISHLLSSKLRLRHYSDHHLRRQPAQCHPPS